MDKNTDIKIHNYCFLLVECFVMIPLLVKDMSIINAGAYAVGIGWLAYLLLGKDEYAGKPAGLLSTIVFVDILLISFLHISELLKNKEVIKALLSSLLNGLVRAIFIIAIAWVVMRFFNSKMKALLEVFMWLIMEITMILLMDSIVGMESWRKYFIIFYTAISVLWFFSVKISKICSEGNEVKFQLKSWILFLLYLSAYLLQSQISFGTYVTSLPQNYLLFYDKYLSWMGLFITVFLCLGLGFWLRPKSKQDKHTTSLVFWSFACILLVMKSLQTFYFTYNWAMAVFYLVLLVWLMSPNRKFAKAEKFRWAGYDILGLTLIELFLAYAFSKGAWMLCIIPVCVAIVYFVEKKGTCLQQNIWITIAILIGASSLFFHYRFGAANVIALLIIAVFGILTGVLMSLPHPARIEIVGKNIRFALQVGVVILLLVLWAHSGSKIQVKQNIHEGTASVEVEAIGKNNSIQKSYYYWTDSKARKVSEDMSFSKSISSISGENECLTIVVIDKNNIKTTRRVWFPYDFFTNK
ncbi:MAG: hypothetical protein U0O33_11905 [Blautia sp.]